jgi:hypothetical protein
MSGRLAAHRFLLWLWAFSTTWGRCPVASRGSVTSLGANGGSLSLQHALRDTHRNILPRRSIAAIFDDQ